METKQPLDPSFYSLVKTYVADAFEVVSRGLKQGSYIDTYGLDWFKIGKWESGLARVEQDYGNAPNDYGMFFHRLCRESKLTPSSFGELLTYVDSNQRLSTYFWRRKGAELHDSSHVSAFGVNLFASDLLDRYMHVVGDSEFRPDRLLPIYLEMERAVFPTKLPVTLLAPILFVGFDFPELEIRSGLKIVQLPDDVQIARMRATRYRFGPPEVVTGSASHAFALQNYEAPNEFRYQQTPTEPEAYPQELIDMCFAALRLITGADTGYAQILLLPDGWLSHPEHTLPSVSGVAIRRYPASFEQYRWLKPINTFTTEDLSHLSVSFKALEPSSASTLGIAARRLNDSCLREREDDALIDAMVALEALLLGNETGEISHKLALRSAAVLTRAPRSKHADPRTCFRNLKLLYAYRSKVVHGAAGEADRQRQKLIDATSMSPVEYSRSLLRATLEVLIAHPALQNPREVDELILSSLQIP